MLFRSRAGRRARRSVEPEGEEDAYGSSGPEVGNEDEISEIDAEEEVEADGDDVGVGAGVWQGLAWERGFARKDVDSPASTSLSADSPLSSPEAFELSSARQPPCRRRSSSSVKALQLEAVTVGVPEMAGMMTDGAQRSDKGGPPCRKPVFGHSVSSGEGRESKPRTRVRRRRKPLLPHN